MFHHFKTIVGISNQYIMLKIIDNALRQENERCSHTERDDDELYLCNRFDIVYEILLKPINKFSKSLVGSSQYTHT